MIWLCLQSGFAALFSSELLVVAETEWHQIRGMLQYLNNELHLTLIVINMIKHPMNIKHCSPNSEFQSLLEPLSNGITAPIMTEIPHGDNS